MIKKLLSIYTVSFILSLFFFELYLNLTNKPKFDNFDKRTILEVYEQSSKNTVIIIPPMTVLKFYSNEFKTFALSGISNQQTIFCNENGYYSIYQSDRYGFNNPDLEWDSKELEYVLIGDSFTHGACVNRPDDIASKLRLLSKKNVINLGYAGNGPLIEYATLREYFLPNAKKYIWIYYEGNDLSDLETELKSKVLNKYLNSETTLNLKFNQNQINQSLKIIMEKEFLDKKKKDTENVKNFIKLNKLRTKITSPPSMVPSTPPLNQFYDILKLSRDMILNNKSEFYFVYLPALERYKLSYNDDFLKKELIKKIVSDLNIKFIDIDENVFKKQLWPLKLFPFETFGHYTPDAYSKIAQYIYEKTQ